MTPTATGPRVLPHVRRALGEVGALVREAVSGHPKVRVGYARSASGRHTLGFQPR
ncbi:hypothetical protein ACI2L1_10750 [Streptomyces sp. NPDC019531]|uniref:hypothetical protein n=1 Tax=Streptomyces sp. NPDC019531 TaxID=3365062 RepID=UPI00384E548B